MRRRLSQNVRGNERGRIPFFPVNIQLCTASIRTCSGRRKDLSLLFTFLSFASPYNSLHASVCQGVVIGIVSPFISVKLGPSDFTL